MLWSNDDDQSTEQFLESQLFDVPNRSLCRSRRHVSKFVGISREFCNPKRRVFDGQHVVEDTDVWVEDAKIKTTGKQLEVRPPKPSTAPAPRSCPG